MDAHLKQQVGTLQLTALAAVFAMPLVGGPAWVSEETLSWILVLEAAVIIYGGFVVSLFFVPMALANRTGVRLGIAGLMLVVGLPLAAGFRHDYGWTGTGIFLWLVFATYANGLLSPIDPRQRLRRLAEIALRWITYLVLFVGLGAWLSESSNIERWAGGTRGLLFGTTFFGLSAVLEYWRVFEKAVSVSILLATHRYRRLPPTRISRRAGRIRGRASGHKVHQWPLILLTGVVCLGLSGLFAYASFGLESWWGRAALWLFLSPFLVIGAIMLAAAPALLYRVWAAKAPTLALDENAMQHDQAVRGDCIIPDYGQGNRRKRVQLTLMCHQIERPPGGIRIATELWQRSLDDEQIQAAGTRIRFETALPKPKQLSDGCQSLGHWSLHVDIDEMDPATDPPESYRWEVVFPLPAPDLATAES